MNGEKKKKEEKAIYEKYFLERNDSMKDNDIRGRKGEREKKNIGTDGEREQRKIEGERDEI